MFRTYFTARELLTWMVLLVVCGGLAAEDKGQSDQQGKWVSLFNGKNLDGWKPKIAGHALNENYHNTFRVEDGLLKVVYEGYERFDRKFGHLFYQTPFAHYRLRVEYRFVGKQVPGGPGWALRNSGVMVHSEAPESMAQDQDFPASIEVQLLGGNGSQDRPTANLCTPGTNVVIAGKLVTRHCTNSRSKTYHRENWVVVEIEVRGSQSIKHIVDGKTVLEYTQPQLDLRDKHASELAKKTGKLLEGGYICLQSESHPIEFRRVEIQQLSP